MAESQIDSHTDERAFQDRPTVSAGELAAPLPEVDDPTDLEETGFVLARSESFMPVDTALGAWREESERRAQAYAAEQKARRRGALKVAGGAVAGLLLVVGGAALLWSGTSTSEQTVAVTPEVPVGDPPAQLDVQGDAQVVTAPESTTEPVAVPASTAAPAVALGAETAPEEPAAVPSVEAPQAGLAKVVEGTLRSWTLDETAWLQFDFVGTDPLTLRWLDSQGAEAIASVECTNRVDETTGRCYVGRSHEAIAWGLGNGAAPGTWTVQACGQAGCEQVATVSAPL